MAKVSGSYERITLGVSEQVAQDRRPGQHHAQLNMVSDPVRGLARRHGSMLEDEVAYTDYLSDAAHVARIAGTARHKTFGFVVDGVDYDLVYRTEPGTGRSEFAWAFNKDTRKFLPIVYSTTDTTLDLLVSGGVSAAVNTGKYVFLAGNDVVPNHAPTRVWDNPANKRKMAVWVRGGAYSRTFQIKAYRANGTSVSAEYKTVSSSYPGILDTSDLNVSDPNYQALVNTRWYAYNAEVTKWIGTAAADITPENIAQKLVEALAALGIAASRQAGTVLVDSTEFVELEADDHGDGSLMRAVGNSVRGPELVSTIHYPGKVVQVKPKNSYGTDAIYLKAIPKEVGATSWTEVTWQETAGYTMQPETVLAIGTVVGGTFYLAGSPSKLAEITPGEHPQFKANEVGDDITCPLPFFFGKRISYLGMFQDRLVIGAGSTLLFSRPGDYFNWFRASVLTLTSSDPIELYALGSEDDTIRASATFDRNLLLFGDRLRYTVNGRTPLTPGTASIVILSEGEDAIDAYPQVAGNLVFYCQYRDKLTSMHQIQTGLLADSPESFNVSRQLDQYLSGRPVEILALNSPNTVLLRTEDRRNRLYTYAYLDNAAGSERLFDAWSEWRWDESLGDVVGLSKHKGDILVYTLRHGLDSTGARKVWIAADKFVLDSTLSDYPYLDSLRPAEGDGFLHEASGLDADVVFERAALNGLYGSSLSEIDQMREHYGSLARAWVGVGFGAYVTPTNPFVRDRNDRAITNGRLTLTKVSVSVENTGGLTVDVASANGVTRAADFNGRLLGRATNIIGEQPIVTTTVGALIGKEVRECKYTISAKGWLPLTVTALEWQGQYFNNARRV